MNVLIASRQARFCETREISCVLMQIHFRAGAKSKKLPWIIKTSHSKLLGKIHNRGGNMLLVFF